MKISRATAKGRSFPGALGRMATAMAMIAIQRPAREAMGRSFAGALGRMATAMAMMAMQRPVARPRPEAAALKGHPR